MRNSNNKKGSQLPQTQNGKDKVNNAVDSEGSTRLEDTTDKRNMENLADENSLAVLKDSFRSNTTGADDDLAVDIQDAIGRDMSLSLVADNIRVTVENEIVTLEGLVYREQEKMTAGYIASIFVGEDNVNNYLTVIGN